MERGSGQPVEIPFRTACPCGPRSRDAGRGGSE